MKHIVILYPKIQIKANMIKLNYLLACLTILKGVNTKTIVGGARNHYEVARIAYNLPSFKNTKNGLIVGAPNLSVRRIFGPDDVKITILR
jgi:hypothetical protein